MEYLDNNRTASALELGRAFRMTGANLRHHLQILTREGKIEPAGQAAPNGRGRPTLLYMTAKQAQGHSLADLAAALLKQILGRRASKQRTQRLKQIARRLAGESGQPDETITQRLVAAVERLNALRYRSHWEAHSDGARLILGQCPYTQIIDNYPELCQMDKHMLKGMLGEYVTQTAKIDRRPEGSGACIFAVGPNSDNLD